MDTADLLIDPSQFTIIDDNYDFLTKTGPSLSDVEQLIADDYTLETAQQYFTPEPWSPTGPPNRNCYSGPYDFRVEVNSSDVNKKKYLYSHRLHRIYVDMECDFSLHFNWRAPAVPCVSGVTSPLLPHTMYVRATVVFTDDAQAEKRVERCTQHYYQNAIQANDELKLVLKNVLHSSRELGSTGVQYCGSLTADDAWFSVLVELNKTNELSVAHAYKFVCKNSCPNGINRRPISILFTLEDKDHKIYGRQMVSARVCACPRRDMHKDEEAEGVRSPSGRAGAKRARAPPPASTTTPLTSGRTTKKIKVEATSTTTALDVVSLPPFDVIGTRAAMSGLEVMRSMMQQTLDQSPEHPAADSYTSTIARLSSIIDEIRAKGNF